MEFLSRNIPGTASYPGTPDRSRLSSTFMGQNLGVDIEKNELTKEVVIRYAAEFEEFNGLGLRK